MITICYDAVNGVPFRDGEIEIYIAAMQSHIANNMENLTLTVATENIINGVRVAVKQKRLPHDQVRMEYAEPQPDGSCRLVHLGMNTNGRYPIWPAGYCDTNERYIDKLIDWTDGILR